MMPWQRRPEHQPGDLYLDPTLSDAERVAVSCGGWTAEATHVWTGTGWARLMTVPVRLVPGAQVQLPPGDLVSPPATRLAS